MPLSPSTYNLDLGIRSGETHQLDFVCGAVQAEVVPGQNTPAFIMQGEAGIRLPSASRMVVEKR